MPGQHATAFAHGKAGLSLSGSGALQSDRARPAARILDRSRAGAAPWSPPSARSVAAASRTRPPVTRHGVTRISSSLGEVRLKFHKRHARSRPWIGNAAAGLARQRRPRTSDRSGTRHRSKASQGNGNGKPTAAAARAAANSAAAAVAGGDRRLARRCRQRQRQCQRQWQRKRQWQRQCNGNPRQRQSATANGDGNGNVRRQRKRKAGYADGDGQRGALNSPHGGLRGTR